MAPKITDLTGQRFERLTVIRMMVKPSPTGKRSKYLCVCRCDCGATSIAEPYHLRHGRHKSCGCLQQEVVTKHGYARKGKESLEYRSWRLMKERCLNPHNHNYPRYGGRGITICERWIDFRNFIVDMGFKPTPKHTLDRIDNNGNYHPGNCRWATPIQQNRNRNKYVAVRPPMPDRDPITGRFKSGKH